MRIVEVKNKQKFNLKFEISKNKVQKGLLYKMDLVRLKSKF